MIELLFENRLRNQAVLARQVIADFMANRANPSSPFASLRPTEADRVANLIEAARAVFNSEK